MALSPTQRTLAALKDDGWECAVVEKWIPRARVRKDLFGVIDIIAIGGARGILGVQSTGQDYAGHYKKMMTEKAQECLRWLQSGGGLELWSWRKVKLERGQSGEVWEPRVYIFKLQDFARRADTIVEVFDPLAL
jgi:hypothetical protein